MHSRLLISHLALIGWASAQSPLPIEASPTPPQPPTSCVAGLDRAGRVHHATDEHAVPWALGDQWKASFGRDGFTYVPFLGSDAPRNFPFGLRVCAVRAGGVEIPFERDVSATRDGAPGIVKARRQRSAPRFRRSR